MVLAICIGFGDGPVPKRQRPHRVLNVRWKDEFDIEWTSDVSRRCSRAPRGDKYPLSEDRDMPCFVIEWKLEELEE